MWNSRRNLHVGINEKVTSRITQVGRFRYRVIVWVGAWSVGDWTVWGRERAEWRASKRLLEFLERIEWQTARTVYGDGLAAKPWSPTPSPPPPRKPPTVGPKGPAGNSGAWSVDDPPWFSFEVDYLTGTYSAFTVRVPDKWTGPMFRTEEAAIDHARRVLADARRLTQIRAREATRMTAQPKYNMGGDLPSPDPVILYDGSGNVIVEYP